MTRRAAVVKGPACAAAVAVAGLVVASDLPSTARPHDCEGKDGVLLRGI